MELYMAKKSKSNDNGETESGATMEGVEVTESPAASEGKASSKKVEYTPVTLEDGTVTQFAGKRKMNKTVTLEADESVTVRFDFLNGATRSLNSAELPSEIIRMAIGHGLSQKIGDQSAGVDEVDDMVEGTDAMIKRLKENDWRVAREAGDSFSGASLVIKALCEVTGKDVTTIREFLDGKLKAATDRGEKLSRKELYDSFRAPGAATAEVIARLERERLAKNVKVSASDMLAELA
jgi:hypothetical protein